MRTFGWWLAVAMICTASAAYAGDYRMVVVDAEGKEIKQEHPLLLSAWYRLQHSVGSTSHDVPNDAAGIDATYQWSESVRLHGWGDPVEGEMNELSVTTRFGFQELTLGRFWLKQSFLGYPRDQLFIEDTLVEQRLNVFDTGASFVYRDDRCEDGGVNVSVVRGSGLRSDTNDAYDMVFRIFFSSSLPFRVQGGGIFHDAIGEDTDSWVTDFFGVETNAGSWYGKAEVFRLGGAGVNPRRQPKSHYFQIERTVNGHWRLGARYERAKLEPGVYSRKEITSLGASYVLTEWSRFQLMYFTDRTVNGGKNEEGVHFALQIHF